MCGGGLHTSTLVQVPNKIAKCAIAPQLIVSTFCPGVTAFTTVGLASVLRWGLWALLVQSLVKPMPVW